MPDRRPRLTRPMNHPERIRTARLLRAQSIPDASARSHLRPRAWVRYESTGAPTHLSDKFASALAFPAGYFSRQPTGVLEVTQAQVDAGPNTPQVHLEVAAAAAALSADIDTWITDHFVIPELDLPELHNDDPRMTARLLRAMWGLGTKPLPNLVQFCESRGIRVYTLPAGAGSIESCHCWIGTTPFILISLRPPPEQVRYNLARELGRLAMRERLTGADENTGAAAFAEEFLTPGNSIIEYLPHNPSTDQLLEARDAFKAPALLLATATHRAGRLTDYAYQQAALALSQRGFRTGEPGGMATFERPRVFPAVFTRHRKSGGATAVAEDLAIPVDDLHALTFGVTLRAAAAGQLNAQPHLTHGQAGELAVVTAPPTRRQRRRAP